MAFNNPLHRNGNVDVRVSSQTKGHQGLRSSASIGAQRVAPLPEGCRIAHHCHARCGVCSSIPRELKGEGGSRSAFLSAYVDRRGDRCISNPMPLKLTAL